MTELDASDEARLVDRARAGEEEAFALLARSHSPRLRRLLYRITGDRELTDDVLQEALTRAWLNIARFEGRSRFSTWLTRIAINEAYDALRPAPVQTLELDDRVGERVAGWRHRPESMLESREFLTAIERALATLPLEYRTAVVLRDITGLSTAEAAEVLGVGERALKSRVHRGRMALRARLDDYLRTGYVE